MKTLLGWLGPLLLLGSAACSGGEGDAGTSAANAGTASNAGGGGAASGGAASGGAASPIGGSSVQTSTGGAIGGSGGAPGLAGAGGSGGAIALGPGELLYLKNCWACHGDLGVGGMLGPEVQHPVRDFSTWVVRNGLPGVGFAKPMEALKADKLSDADLKLIYDYLDTPPQPTTGQALYHDYCANCHGADGAGGPTTRAIKNEAGKVEEFVRKGTHQGEFNLRNEYMPKEPQNRINDAELILIRDYVGTL